MIEPFHLSVLAAVRDWLKQNGISAEIEHHTRRTNNGHEHAYAIISCSYGYGGGCFWHGNLSVKEGCVRMASYENLDLALPDSLDILVDRIKGGGRYDKDRGSHMG